MEEQNKNRSMPNRNESPEGNCPGVEKLIQKGVNIILPQTVWVDDSVDPDRISAEATIYPGCRIQGKKTLILDGAKIGAQEPASLINCLVGPDAVLGGGYYNKAVFLEKSSTGTCAHVREGTICEEESSTAHSAALKQTILFPFVILGSLINFCDCLMAGGTDRKNHSEVGSSFIHFNFTPNQDKATPSLLGDVPQGVMLRQDPIFLGGQGGLVGPARLAFGTVTAAGSVVRKDELRPGRLIFTANPKARSMAFKRGEYTGLDRLVRNNIIYLGNLLALRAWYGAVRALFVSVRFPPALFSGLCQTLDTCIEERIKRLKMMIAKLRDSGSAPPGAACLWEQWDELAGCFANFRDDGRFDGKKETLLSDIQKSMDQNSPYYPDVIKGISQTAAKAGTSWLAHLVRLFCESCQNRIQDFKIDL